MARATAQRRLVRAEVADVVPRDDVHAERLRALGERGEHREELEEIVGLQEDVGLVGGAPHRDGELDLPALRAGNADALEDLGEIRHREAIDLRVRRDEDAGRAEVRHRVERGAPRPLHAAEAIVGRFFAVDRHAGRVEARLPGASARSRVSPRPPVVIVGIIPCALIARMISTQSSRRYASPPMSATSRVPISASWRTRSRHSAVVISFGRSLPAREPQCRQARSQRRVISQTATIGR